MTLSALLANEFSRELIFSGLNLLFWASLPVYWLIFSGSSEKTPGLSELSVSGHILSLSLRWRNDCLWGWLNPSLTLCTNSSPILLLLYPCNHQLSAPRWTILNNTLTLVGPSLTAHSSARRLPHVDLCVVTMWVTGSTWGSGQLAGGSSFLPPCSEQTQFRVGVKGPYPVNCLTSFTTIS